MRRRVLALVSLLSLLLCVAVVAMWVRSYRVRDVCVGDFRKLRHSFDIESVTGELYFAYEPGYVLTDEPVKWMHLEDEPGRAGLPGGLGFSFSGSVEGIRIVVPHWAAVLGLLVMPTLWIGLRVFSRRVSGDPVCSGCSYNLRGNTSGICPECGSPILGPASPSKNVRTA